MSKSSDWDIERQNGDLPPDWLHDLGKAKWHELLKAHPQLINQPNELAMLCDAWATYLCAVRDINSVGVVIFSGERVWNNPAVNTKEQERKSIIKLSVILGLIKDNEQEELPSPLRALIENR